LADHGALSLGHPATGYFDRIVPVAQTQKWDNAVRSAGKTAMALGRTIPPSVLARADEVIE
jgi:hypothetical protein